MDWLSDSSHRVLPRWFCHHCSYRWLWKFTADLCFLHFLRSRTRWTFSMPISICYMTRFTVFLLRYVEFSQIFEDLLAWAAKVCATLNPIAVEGLSCWNSILGIIGKHFFDKIKSLSWNFFPNFQTKINFPLKNSFSDLFVRPIERRSSGDQNVHYDSTRPHITLFTIILVENFWSSIIERSWSRLELLLEIILPGCPKVNHFDILFVLQHDILQFQVAINFILTDEKTDEQFPLCGRSLLLKESASYTQQCVIQKSRFLYRVDRTNLLLEGILYYRLKGELTLWRCSNFYGLDKDPISWRYLDGLTDAIDLLLRTESGRPQPEDLFFLSTLSHALFRSFDGVPF